MGKKLESSFKNMVLVLFLVTLVSSAAVGVVNSLTSGLIEKVKIEKQVQAIRAVVPAFDNDPMTEKQIVKVDGEQQSRDLFNKSNYQASPKIITIGTKGANKETLAALKEAVATGDEAKVRSAASSLKTDEESKKEEEDKKDQENTSDSDDKKNDDKKDDKKKDDSSDENKSDNKADNKSDNTSSKSDSEESSN